MYPWQQQVVDWVKQTPDDRTIHWIVDSAGSGKTTIGKLLCRDYNAALIYCTDKEDLMNLATQQKDADIYIIDFTAAQAQSPNLYAALEEIKDGHWTNTGGKYEGVLRDCPHVIIFSRTTPLHDALPEDRLKVYKVDPSDKTLNSIQ